MGNISSADINSEIEKGFNKTINNLKDKTNEVVKTSENYIQLRSNQIKYDFINQTNKETEIIKRNFIESFFNLRINIST